MSVVRRNSRVDEAQLVAAIVKGTGLPQDQATALAQAIAEPPAYVEWAVNSSFPAQQVADVLTNQGFEVAFDA
jgi:hypothetical protein